MSLIINTTFNFDTSVRKKHNVQVISMGSGTDKAFIIWNNDTAAELFGTVIDISGTTLTPGTSKRIDTEANSEVFRSFKGLEITRLTDTKLLAVYQGFDDLEVFTLVITISGTTFTFGSNISIDSAECISASIATLSDTKVIYTWIDSSSELFSVIGTISGTIITDGSFITIDAGVNDNSTVISLSDTKALCFYTDVTNGRKPTAVILDVSGTTITDGTGVTCDNDPATRETIINEVRGRKRLAKVTSTRAVAVWVDDGDKKIKGCILDVSGSTITPRTSVDLTGALNSQDQAPSVVVKNDTELLLVYDDNGTNGRVVPLTISGNTLSADTGDDTIFNSSTPNWESIDKISDTNYIVAWNDESDADGKMVIIGFGVNFDLTHSAGGIPGAII